MNKRVVIVLIAALAVTTVAILAILQPWRTEDAGGFLRTEEDVKAFLIVEGIEGTRCSEVGKIERQRDGWFADCRPPGAAGYIRLFFDENGKGNFGF